MGGDLGSFNHFVIWAQVTNTYGEDLKSEKPPFRPLDNTTSIDKSPVSTSCPRIPLTDV